LLKKYQALQVENDALRRRGNQLQQELDNRENQIRQLQENIRTVNLSASAANKQDEHGRKELKSLVNEYIKEIDRCIAALSS
jgi:hypothetical protein